MTRWLVAILGVAACGDSGAGTDIDASLRFADLTDAQISRLAGASTGNEGFAAQSNVARFEEPTEMCPAVVIDAGARVVTITGNCSRSDGIEVQGAVTLTNPQSWGELTGDFNQATVYQFEDFALVQSGITMRYDGRFEIGSLYGYVDMDLTSNVFDFHVRSDLRMDCGSTTDCDIAGGLELVDVGGVHVRGNIRVQNQSVVTHTTLSGEGTVVFDVAAGCTRWQLEGTDRAYDTCPDSP